MVKTIMKMTRNNDFKEKTREIDKVAVERIAELSCLCLSEKEKEKIAQELCRVLELADTLPSIEADTLFESGVIGVGELRDDREKTEFIREEMLASARTRSNEYITVPRIIDEEVKEDA